MTKNIEYRTQEQFEEILESMYNGQWRQATKLVEEYGFGVKDYLDKLEENEIKNIENLENTVYLFSKQQYN